MKEKKSYLIKCFKIPLMQIAISYELLNNLVCTKKCKYISLKVKLWSSGKDRQGMAPKAKGLKA